MVKKNRSNIYLNYLNYFKSVFAWNISLYVLKPFLDQNYQLNQIIKVLKQLILDLIWLSIIDS